MQQNNKTPFSERITSLFKFGGTSSKAKKSRSEFEVEADEIQLESDEPVYAVEAQKYDIHKDPLQRRSTRSEYYHEITRLPFFLPPKTSTADQDLVSFQDLLKEDGLNSETQTQTQTQTKVETEKDEESEIEQIISEYKGQKAASFLHEEFGENVPPPPNKFPRSPTGKVYTGYKHTSKQLEKNVQLYELSKNKQKQKQKLKTDNKIYYRDIDLDIDFGNNNKNNKNKNFVLIILATVSFILLLCVSLFFGLDLDYKISSSSSSSSPFNSTSVPTHFPTITTTIIGTTSYPTAFPIEKVELPTVSPTVLTLTKSPTLFPTVSTSVPNLEEIEKRVRSVCSETSGKKDFVGMCLDREHYAQCDKKGKVSKSYEMCHVAVSCLCQPFVRVLDRNPCSAQDGNSCEEDV